MDRASSVAAAPDDRAAWRAAFTALKRGWLSRGGLACSGGHDSTALLLLAARARDRGVVGEFVALHVDHGIRPESPADADFISRLCAALRVPCARATLRWDAPRHAGEDELRRRRYDALGTLAARLGLAGVMTAHTRDDQVETVLMRLLSGSGPAAAAGMGADASLPTVAGALRVRRPLLGASRAEVDAVLRAAGVTPREDVTNADPRYRRNALRREIIPRLRAIFPGFEEPLLRAARLAADDAALVDGLAAEAASAVVRRVGEEARVERAWLAAAAPALARRVLRSAVERLADVAAAREMTYERLEALRRAACGRPGAVIELPGGVAGRVERDALVLYNVAGGPAHATADDEER